MKKIIMSDYRKWFHPYKPDKKYSKKVAYFSMEFAIDQPLKTYSGGLGFLAGSHMRSGYEKKQNLIGIGMLWKYGYYDQGRQADQSLDIKFVEKNYNFLEDTGIVVPVTIKENTNVLVKAYCLKPEVFGTVPMYFLSTDLPENDFISRTITDRLYDSNELTRIAQSIVLGIGGAKIVEALGGADVYHLNEGHGLPAFFHLQNQGVKKDQFVFTTHTPEKAGNEERDAQLLNEMGFYGKELMHDELLSLTDNTGMLNYTVAALRLSKVSNGVSKLHGVVSNDMWKSFKDISKIISITNSQNRTYWQDDKIADAVSKSDSSALSDRKKEMKKKLFDRIANETGKILDPDVLTIVWARRFAGYKRADLLLWDSEKFQKLITDKKRPIQIIWAGKPYPLDEYAVGVFNKLIQATLDVPNCTVVTGYELELSRLLKEGSDIWLNNPRITREASGTSGMTAAMNGSVNVSTDDGWIPEFAKNGKNSFVLPALDHKLSHEDQDETDAKNLYNILEKKILKLYYDKPKEWNKVVMASTKEVLPFFDSGRMADEYYQLMYNSNT